MLFGAGSWLETTKRIGRMTLVKKAYTTVTLVPKMDVRDTIVGAARYWGVGPDAALGGTRTAITVPSMSISALPFAVPGQGSSTWHVQRRPFFLQNA
jgi:hypothetical protein